MTLNLSNLELTLVQKINSSTNPIDVQTYTKALEKLRNNMIYSVDTFANIPDATSSDKQLYWVIDEKSLYWAQNGAWTSITTTGVGELFIAGRAGNIFAGCGPVFTAICRSSPVQEPFSNNNWESVTEGNWAAGHAGAIKSDGTLWSWGYNNLGAAGTGNQICYTTPRQEFYSFTGWCQLSMGCQYSMALKRDGCLYGTGRMGPQRGVAGSTSNQITCYRITMGPQDYCQVFAGRQTTGGVKNDGTLWMWGNNVSGQVAQNDVITYSSPMQEIGRGTTWIGGSVDDQFAGGIKSDGTVWTWGANTLGQLGTNDVVSYSSPVQEITSSTDWCTYSSGTSLSTSIKTNGTLWAWGRGLCGGLAQDNLVDYSSPVQEITSTTEWCCATGGSTRIVALKTDSTLWAWGYNTFGGLMINCNQNVSSPVQEITSSTDWVSIGSGSDYTIGIRATTTLG